MSINLKMPDITELKPRITVFGVGGAGCNAVNNMIEAGLQGVDFVVANTDSQALTMTKADRLIQMGVAVTQGLGAGSQPEIGRAAAEETLDEITDHLNGSHMAFITAGMGGGTGTGAAPIVARAARDAGILTVGVVTKPFQFEGQRRMRIADAGILELQKHVDTLIVIPNQNLFRIANDKTTFADAFAMADEVLYSGVACITDLMVKDGLINLDFADVRSVMREMGKAMMGTGEASGDKRAIEAAEKAIANPLLDDVCMRGARGLLISITGGRDMTLFEVDEAASRVREEVDGDANIIFGATFDEGLEGTIRVSVVATGIEPIQAQEQIAPPTAGMAELARRLKSVGAPAQPQPQQASAIRCRPMRWRGLSRSLPRRMGTTSSVATPPRRRRMPPPRRGSRAIRRCVSARSAPTPRSFTATTTRRLSAPAPTRRPISRPSTSFRRRRSGRIRCRRACRAWKTSRRWRSGRCGSGILRPAKTSAARADCWRGWRAALRAITRTRTSATMPTARRSTRTLSRVWSRRQQPIAPAAEYRAPQPRRIGEAASLAGGLDSRGRHDSGRKGARGRARNSGLPAPPIELTQQDC